MMNLLLNEEDSNLNDIKIVIDDKDLDNLEYNIYSDKKEISNLMKKISICLDKFNDNDEILLTKCNHIFHKDCINKWIIDYNIKCPICKEKIANSKIKL